MAGERQPQPRPTHAHGTVSRLETCVVQGTQWGAAHPALDPRATPVRTNLSGVGTESLAIVFEMIYGRCAQSNAAGV